MKIQRTVFFIAAFLLVPAYFICAQSPGPQTPLDAEIEGNVIIAKLVDGDSLFSKILQISTEYSLSAGIVLFNIGQLRNFSLGQYNPVSKRYVSNFHKLPWELVSMQGTICLPEGGYGGMQVNCQATLADSTGGVIAGHLTNGIVSVANEIVILRLVEINLIRNYNINTGYWELNISK